MMNLQMPCFDHMTDNTFASVWSSSRAQTDHSWKVPRMWHASDSQRSRACLNKNVVCKTANVNAKLQELVNLLTCTQLATVMKMRETGYGYDSAYKQPHQMMKSVSCGAHNGSKQRRVQSQWQSLTLTMATFRRDSPSSTNTIPAAEICHCSKQGDTAA